MKENYLINLTRQYLSNGKNDISGRTEAVDGAGDMTTDNARQFDWHGTMKHDSFRFHSIGCCQQQPTNNTFIKNNNNNNNEGIKN